MSTLIMSFSSAVAHEPVRSDDTATTNSKRTVGTATSFRFCTTDVMNEFVRLLKDNPKVWAVAANGDPGGIGVCIYVDSEERRDREAVYESGWELMKRYPDVEFDFSAILAPAGSVILERGQYSFLHRPTLEAWFGNLSEGKSAVGGPLQIAAEIVLRHMRNLPPEIMNAMPEDGASQHDHYIYGWPKREA